MGDGVVRTLSLRLLYVNPSPPPPTTIEPFEMNHRIADDVFCDHAIVLLLLLWLRLYEAFDSRPRLLYIYIASFKMRSTS